MSGTLLSDSNQERADHEAGHFIMAVALKLNFRCEWLTIEPRANSGGSFGLRLYETPTPEQTVQYLLGGLVAQASGLIFRERVRRARDEADNDDLEAALDQFIARAIASGHDDIVKMGAVQVSPEALQSCARVIYERWEECVYISDALVENITLFGQEPQLILRAHETGDIRRHMILKWYRQRRKQVEPMSEWSGGETAQTPAGRWFEDFQSWWSREGWDEVNESFEDWHHRLFDSI